MDLPITAGVKSAKIACSECGAFMYRDYRPPKADPICRPCRRDPEKTAARFWRKVNKNGPIMPDMNTPCWQWLGRSSRSPRNKTSYGYFAVAGRRRYVSAHRFAYELTYGSPDNQVDHRCHNTLCVRPDHLRAATNKQNAEHQTAKRTSKTGIRGVMRKASGRFYAQVEHNGQKYTVGTFTTLEDAARAVTVKRCELFTHNDYDRMIQ